MYEDFTQEGAASFSVASVDTPCSTYYKIFGDIQSGPPPVVVVHGGPGAGHEYCLPFSHLWSRFGIPVVFYDQIGCGASTHLRQKADDQSFWHIDLFVAELQSLLSHFHLSRDDGPGYHVLGHSFGGRVAAAFASRQPAGLRKLILAAAAADGRLFLEGIWRLTRQLSPEAQKAIEEAVKKSDFTSAEYKDAYTEFGRTFLCRADPWPADLAKSMKNQQEDATVQKAMQGVSPWVYNGTLSKYSSIPILSKISAPTLVYNGEFDTTQYEPTVPFFNYIPRVRWMTLANASHMPHLDSAEMLEKVLKLLGEFLQQSEGS